MKSIVEEASSIIKAIEKAWLRADKPAKFQITILEEPKRNFLGMTVKSAKIGLFFEHEGEVARKPFRKEIWKERRQPVAERIEVRKEVPETSVKKEKKFKPRWTSDMVQTAEASLQQILATMGCSDIHFSSEVKGYYLRILFSKPLLEDRSKEQLLFKSLAHLMMQVVQTKFKKGFAGFKVVLKSVR